MKAVFFIENAYLNIHSTDGTITDCYQEINIETAVPLKSKKQKRAFDL